MNSPFVFYFRVFSFLGNANSSKLIKQNTRSSTDFNAGIAQ